MALSLQCYSTVDREPTKIFYFKTKPRFGEDANKQACMVRGATALSITAFAITKLSIKTQHSA
jgi:hypothetical protein